MRDTAPPEQSQWDSLRSLTLWGARSDGSYSTAGVDIAWSLHVAQAAPRAVLLYFHGNGETADDLQSLAPGLHAAALAVASEEGDKLRAAEQTVYA